MNSIRSQLIQEIRKYTDSDLNIKFGHRAFFTRMEDGESFLNYVDKKYPYIFRSYSEGGELYNLWSYRASDVIDWISCQVLECPIVERPICYIGDSPFYSDNEPTVPDFIKFVRACQIPPLFTFQPLQRNTLYVLHPLDDKLYIPFVDSDVVLLKEKTREFIKFMSALGAKKVNAFARINHFNESNISSSYNINVGGNYKAFGGSASYSSSSSIYEKDVRSNELNFTAVFDGRKNLSLISSLKWYHIESSWKEIQDIIESGTKYYKESFSTSSIRSVNSSNRESIKADLKILFAKASVDYNSETIRKVNTQDDLIETIEVEF